MRLQSIIPTGAPDPGWHWDHSYARLPDLFFVKTMPVAVEAPRLAVLNRMLAVKLGLNVEALEAESSAGIFTGNQIPRLAEPLAQAYAGHQYGHFTALGDGRAILLGEHLAPDGQRFDVQLKGAGVTPFSRRGDGRAALGPMLREFVIGEAMHALGIPTTRALAVAVTGETVMRENIQPGAVLTRIAASHIRVGTFEWAAAHQDAAALEALARYTLQRHFPDDFPPEAGDVCSPCLALLRGAIARQAELIARWMLVGFVHGVMNTDNMALSGETIDYGPCAFIDAYNPAAVFSSIDRHGRYAYGNQPTVAQWNLTRLAEALLPCVDPNPDCALELAREALAEFIPAYRRHWLAGMRKKLGLSHAEPEDESLVQALLGVMQRAGLDYCNTFRSLEPEGASGGILPGMPEDFVAWRGRWWARLARQADSTEQIAIRMKESNPAVIPRNHQVEHVLSAAVEHGDWEPLNRLLAVLATPYAPGAPDEFTTPPPLEFSRNYQTYCGT